MTEVPVIAVATLIVKPDKQAELEAALLEVIPQVHEEDGCLLYALHRQAGKDDTYVMVEKWESKEAFRAHGKGRPLAALNEALAGVLAAPTEVKVLRPIPGGETNRGQL